MVHNIYGCMDLQFKLKICSKLLIAKQHPYHLKEISAKPGKMEREGK